MIRITTPVGPIGSSDRALPRRCGAWVTARKYWNRNAPMRMKKIAAEVRSESTSASMIFAQVRRRRAMPMTSAPSTPSPAASDTVTIPP